MGGNFYKNRNMEDSPKAHSFKEFLWASYPESFHSGENDWMQRPAVGLVGSAALHPACGGDSVLSPLSTAPTNITNPLSYIYTA